MHGDAGEAPLPHLEHRRRARRHLKRLVADPLAVTLTIACNMVLIRFWDVKRPQYRTRAEPQAPGLFDSLVERARSMAMLAYRETFEQEKPGAHRRHAGGTRKPAARKAKKR